MFKDPEDEFVVCGTRSIMLLLSKTEQHESPERRLWALHFRIVLFTVPHIGILET